MVGLLLRAGFTADLTISALVALLACGGGLLLLFHLPALRRSLPFASLRLGSVTGNTAYWGLPVSLALLPPAAIGHAIAFDLVATLITWSVGPLLIGGVPAGPAAVLLGLAVSPACRGFLLALLFQMSPWTSSVAALLWWPARLVMLVALVVVGMRLAEVMEALREGQVLSAGLRLALLSKLFLFPMVILALVSLLGLPSLVRQAVVLQAAAPTAVSVLLLAEASGREAETAAALVLGSTVMALLSVPLWWLLLTALP
jgi:predicted permease